MNLTITLRAALSACVLALLAACAPAQAPAQTSGTISVRDAWARPTPKMSGMAGMNSTPAAGMPGMADGPVTAGYMTIENTGSAPETLIGVNTAAAGVAEVHETSIVNGVASMAPVKGGLIIPAGGSVQLKPGGYHLMLMDLKQEFVTGSAVGITLKFASGKQMPIQLTVREP